MIKAGHFAWFVAAALAAAGCDVDPSHMPDPTGMGDAGPEDDDALGCVTDDDCNNDNPCEAREQCDVDTGACEPIEPLDEGVACAGGRVCDTGLCVLEVGTECETDADCDDGNSCNGVDYCDKSTGMCMVTTCNDGDPCTDNVCSTNGPCTFVFIDQDGDGYAPAVACTNPALKGGDCDDTKAWVHPGAPEVCDLHFTGRLEEVDNNCNGYDGFAPESGLPNLYFRDRDGDGYGDANEGVPCPLSGYVRGHTFGAGSPGAPDRRPYDCFDGPSPTSAGASVYPNQFQYFEAPYCKQGVATKDAYGQWYCAGTAAFSLPSWDYDCDGSEALLWTLAGGFCACDSEFRIIDCETGCSPSSWSTSTPPGCGVTAGWTNCSLNYDYSSGYGWCEWSMDQRTQRCR
jgi:hypothetical protein